MRPLHRKITYEGRSISLSLEDVFWGEFRRVAAEHGVTQGELLRRAVGRYGQLSRSAAVRCYLMENAIGQQRVDACIIQQLRTDLNRAVK